MSEEKTLAKAESVFLGKVNEDVKKFYKTNADVGSTNLAGSLPQLKVTESNSKNEGPDGQFTKAGTFYYSPTGESFDELEVSIMTISRGFYALDNSKEPKPKFTQLVGGMILESKQPFITFISGTRLQGMWDFGKEIKPFTKNKENPVPMMAFKVTLKLREVKTNYGTNHVIDFHVAKKGNQIEVIQDLELLNVISSGVDQIESTFEGFIEQKEVDRDSGKLIKTIVQEINQPAETGEDINDDIPF